jgi:hypothetical protein
MRDNRAAPNDSKTKKKPLGEIVVAAAGIYCVWWGGAYRLMKNCAAARWRA